MAILNVSPASESTLLSLPDELFLEIIHWLKTLQLKTLSLVNSRCRSICQEVLFADVKITSTSWNPIIVELQRHLLISQLTGRPSLLSYTSTLSLRGPFHGYDVLNPPVMNEDLFTILHACSESLQVLSIDWLRVQKTAFTAALPSLRFPKLEWLCVEEALVGPNVLTPDSFPSLRHLAAMCCADMVVPRGLTTLQLGCENVFGEGHNGFLRKVIETNHDITSITPFHTVNAPFSCVGMPGHFEMLSLITCNLTKLTTLSMPLSLECTETDEKIRYYTEYALIKQILEMMANLTSLCNLQFEFASTIFDCELELTIKHFNELFDCARGALQPLTNLNKLSIGIKKYSSNQDCSAEIMEERLLQRVHVAEYAKTFRSLEYLCVKVEFYDRKLNGYARWDEGILCQIKRSGAGIVSFEEHDLESPAFFAFQKVFKGEW